MILKIYRKKNSSHILDIINIVCLKKVCFVVNVFLSFALDWSWCHLYCSLFYAWGLKFAFWTKNFLKRTSKKMEIWNITRCFLLNGPSKIETSIKATHECYIIDNIHIFPPTEKYIIDMLLKLNKLLSSHLPIRRLSKKIIELLSWKISTFFQQDQRWGNRSRSFKIKQRNRHTIFKRFIAPVTRIKSEKSSRYLAIRS